MPNRLAHETSPYLLQHAHNPVDWYPWGEEALARARAEDRPILLSVGYSACHWCHVMERESFEDPAIAAQMNRHFVNIKVDREERPDLDELYMQAVQAFTGGHGGWPMTLFLTPGGRPWFGGTYFPPGPSRGMPGFNQVLEHARRVWAERRAEVEQVGEELAGHLQSLGRLPQQAAALQDVWLDAVAEAAWADFDPTHGGFGGAPKFPPHGTLAVLLAHHQRTGERRSLDMALHTLREMARGGMYDLLGGGFARYSVDERWCVPHFEKMLYDNAQLIPLYIDAWRITGEPSYARVARECVGWALREMRLPGGGFAAALDADSEGEEGRFFAWTPAQLREVLGVVDGLHAAALLGVSDAGSFEHGRSVLRLDRPIEELPPEPQALLARARPALFAARAQRVPPGRDDKVIVAWNALMISALAQAGVALGDPEPLAAACAAARFVLDEVQVGGRLHRTWKDGRVGPLGCLDDYAGLVLALVDLYECTLEPLWLEEALTLADALVALFGDDPQGALFFTGRDAEALLTRPRNLIGGATPSGPGLAALGLARLAALCGREDLGQRADAVLRAYQTLLPRAARALGVEALAATWRAAHHPQLGLVGEGAQALLATARRRALPFVSIAGPSPRVPWMADRAAPGGRATAYLCEGGACRRPTQDPEELLGQLEGVVASRLTHS